MPDHAQIPDGRRRAVRARNAERTPAAAPVTPQEQLLALARSAGNAAIARTLSPAGGRTLMRTHSAAGDLATVDDVVAVLEGNDPPLRQRAMSAPPVLGAAPLAAPPLEVPPDTSPAEPEAEPEPEPAPVEVVVPEPRKPRIPKSPDPLPTHPTISDEKAEAFNVQAHAQFVRDELALASEVDANRPLLAVRLSEVDLIAKGLSTDSLDVQRTKIKAADVACQPLRDALQHRLKAALEDAIKPGNVAYARIRTLENKARSLVPRYEWKLLVTTLGLLESATKAAEQIETLAAKATTSVTYLKDAARLDEFGKAPSFGRLAQKEALTEVEDLVSRRHAAQNLPKLLADLTQKLAKAEGDYTDIALWGKVQTAVADPSKKGAARTALKTLLDNGVLRKGTIVSKYRDTSKGPGFYGVEWTLEGTDRIVVHSHINAAGNANDANATHVKLRGTKLLGGTSIGMPAGWQGDALMDPETNRTTPCPFPADDT